MGRIKSCNVNFGSSLVIGKERGDEEQERKIDEANAKIERLTSEALANAALKARGIIDDAKEKARETIEEAEKKLEEAKNKKLEAETEIEQLREVSKREGYQEGFDSGYAEGEAKIRQEMQEKIDNVDFFAKENFEIKKKILDSSRSDMLNLCFEICKKVCASELDSAMLEKIINRALKLLDSKTVVNVIISEHLASKLETDFDKKFQHVRVIQNPNIADDSIIVESLNGNIDCSISAQIEKIASELLNAQ